LQVPGARLRGAAAAEAFACLDHERQEGGEAEAGEPLLAGERGGEEALLEAGQLGRETIIVRGNNEIARALSSGDEKPLPGSRRFASTLKTVPRPITTNVIVREAASRDVRKPRRLAKVQGLARRPSH